MSAPQRATAYVAELNATILNAMADITRWHGAIANSLERLHWAQAELARFHAEGTLDDSPLQGERCPECWRPKYHNGYVVRCDCELAPDPEVNECCGGTHGPLMCHVCGREHPEPRDVQACVGDPREAVANHA